MPLNPKKPGSIRTTVAQIHVRPGYPVENTRNMLSLVERAKRAGEELIVFPEMAIPGYLLGDEWERPAFLRECERCGNDLIAASIGIIVIFGNVAVDWQKTNEDGRVRKYNALFVAESGRLIPPRGSNLPWVIKALMPNYRQFDDSRHFYDLRKLALEKKVHPEALIQPVDTSRASLGCMLCEDAWDADYTHSPLSILAEQGCDLFVNISASPFTFNKENKRNRVFNSAATEFKRPMIYANQISLQNNGKTIFAFDGKSGIYDGSGNQTALETAFLPDTLSVDIPLTGVPFGKPLIPHNDTMGDLLDALEFGARNFMEQISTDRVTIGVSGGIDSALSAALYSRILPPENILLLNMPGRYNSSTTKSLAARLAENLGTFYATVPIEESVTLTSHQVDNLHISRPGGSRRKLTLTDFMLENVQARDRSSRILAAVSSAFGGVFTCNANKSEITVGYGTLYGDICGFLALLADLWKTEVWELSRYMNNNIFGSEIIPAGSITLVPSAELSAEHNVDAGRGDPLIYPYHDKLFASWVEYWERVTPEENLEWYLNGSLSKNIGYNGDPSDLFPTCRSFTDDLERWWNLYQGMALAKRIQAPPVMAVKRRAFGFDQRESQLGPRYTRRYVELKDKAD